MDALMQAKNRIGNISFLIFWRFCFVIKKGDKIKEAINNLENTRAVSYTHLTLPTILLV